VTHFSLFLKHTLLTLLISSSIGGLFFSPYLFPQQKVNAQTDALAGCVGALLGGMGVDYAGQVGDQITSEISGINSVPVIDRSVLNQAIKTARNTSSLENKERYLDPCLKGIIKEIVHQLTNSIIAWINNGFEGSPTFISNPEGFFGDIADQTLGLFIEGAGLDFLCTPFKLDIQLQLRRTYRRDTRVYCTPSRIAQVQGFVDKPFSEVGWGGWLELTQNEENNVYGSWNRANTDLNDAVNYRINSKLNELAWGNGFLSVRDPETNQINTPGSIIVRQADRALGSNLEELQLADEFDDIINALINQLTSQLLTEGLRSN